MKTTQLPILGHAQDRTQLVWTPAGGGTCRVSRGHPYSRRSRYGVAPDLERGQSKVKQHCQEAVPSTIALPPRQPSQ